MSRKKQFILDYEEEIKEVLDSGDIEEVRAMLEFLIIHINDRLEYLLNNACNNLGITYEQLKSKDYGQPDSHTQELLNESYTLLNIIDKALESYNKELEKVNEASIKSLIEGGNTDTSKH